MYPVFSPFAIIRTNHAELDHVVGILGSRLGFYSSLVVVTSCASLRKPVIGALRASVCEKDDKPTENEITAQKNAPAGVEVIEAVEVDQEDDEAEVGRTRWSDSD